MKFAYIAAILSVTLIAFEVSAQPPGGKGGGKGKNATGQRTKGDRGKGGARGGQRLGDPAQLAARMMKEFDKDGDDKLSTTELTALLTSLRERRGGGPQGNRSPDGKGKGKGKSKSRSDANAEPAGGKKPKRPAAE